MPPETIQRLLRLAPLAEIQARIAAVAPPVPAREIDLADACGRVLAADVAVAAPLPPQALALRDGFAVASHSVTDAGPYAPVPVAPVWVETGAPLPPAADAVLAPDAVTVTDGRAEAVAAAGAGDGVLPAGADADATPLRRAGDALRASDVAALRAAGLRRAAVREPRLRVAWTHADIAPEHDAVAALIARDISCQGGQATVDWTPGDAKLSDLLGRDDDDAVIAIGGTGAGGRDRSVHVLSRVGRLDLHGMGIRPGETAALGTVRSRPVLVLPGRLDAALAAWLIVGRHLLARLTGRAGSDPAPKVALTRKVVSVIGLAEVFPVGWHDDGVEPLAAGYFPLQALTRAAGWIFVPPESEGFAAGTTVELRPLP
ncbi:MAG TPA: molybdopterin-binding protein [Xanthobacteraceae bacterium]|nr:molybdopterin-binding protein [Xanthobacteraceae bacterium]